MYALLAALLACQCAAPTTAPRLERAWTQRDPQQIVARFSGQAEVSLSPEQAFRARERCASITRAVVSPLPAVAARRPTPDPATPPAFAGVRVEIEGVGLERVTRIAAHLPAPVGTRDATKPSITSDEAARPTSPDASAPGALADIKVVRTAGKLVFPVFCASCEIVLGVPLDRLPGAPVAGCAGPGWSLRFRNGTLSGD